MLSATAVAALSVLLAPLPAHAAPTPVGVPDSGSRPAPIGALRMPGTTAPTVTTPVTTIATTPLLAKVEKKRELVATLGDRLLELREQQGIAQQQASTVDTRHRAARAALDAARAEASAAAAESLRESAGLLPDEYGSDLHGLGALAKIQRGEAAGRESAARHLALAEAAFRLVDAEKLTANTRAATLTTEYEEVDTRYRREQAALTKLEADNRDQLLADEAADEAREQNLGQQYVIGGDLDGKGAHPSAVVAVRYALGQLGDMYLWAAAGPDRFDCSGLVLASYRSAGYGRLPHSSRHQYRATRDTTVNPSQLVPGDLLFFSSSSSWTGIHHVAMYVGNGRMVEAPRSGVPVRVTTVRWSRLFAATRIYAAVDEPVKPPAIPKPTPAKTKTTGPTPSPTEATADANPTTTKPEPDPSTSTPTPEPTASSSSPSPAVTTPSPNPGPSSGSPSASASGSTSTSTSASHSTAGSTSHSTAGSHSTSTTGPSSRSASAEATGR